MLALQQYLVKKISACPALKPGMHSRLILHNYSIINFIPKNLS